MEKEDERLEYIILQEEHPMYKIDMIENITMSKKRWKRKMNV